MAVVASKDDEAYDEAVRRHDRALKATISSSAELAIALYNFALRYAEQPGLINAKLKELGIQSKRDTSVYGKIARLAFDDLSDPDAQVSHPRISRYAQLIEAAHNGGMSADDFKKLVAIGVTKARERLLGAPQQPSNDVLEQGRGIVSGLLENRTFPIDQLPLPSNVNEGDDVELLARVEGGKLVVYGVVPNNLSNAQAVLKKLVSQQPGAPKIGDILPELLLTLKLVTAQKDADCIATYVVSGDQITFTVTGPKAVAWMIAPATMDFIGGQSLALKAEDWRRLLNTLNPIRKHIQSVSFDGAKMQVDVNEKEVPEINKWFEKARKAISIGKAKGNSLEIGLDQHVEGDTVLKSSGWKGATSFTEDALKPLLEFKPAKQYVSFSIADSPLAPTSSAKPIAGNQNIVRVNLSILKSAAKKFLRWGESVTLDHIDEHLRISVQRDSGVDVAVIVKAE